MDMVVMILKRMVRMMRPSRIEEDRVSGREGKILIKEKIKKKMKEKKDGENERRTEKMNNLFHKSFGSRSSVVEA